MPTLRINPVGSNMTELELNGAQILFSYKTPVAAFVKGKGWIRTNKFWSVTTSKHINKWLAGIEANTVDQSVLDSLLKKAR